MTTYNERLGQLESSGRYDIENQYGFLGKYQLGADALYDLGVVARKPRGVTQSQWLSDRRNWKNGLSKEDFLSNPSLQENLINIWNQTLDKRSKHYGLDKFYGKQMNGQTLTQENIRAASHLLGSKKVADLLKSGDLTSATDANKTTALDYVSQFQPINEGSAMNEDLLINNSNDQLNHYSVNPGQGLITPYEMKEFQLPQNEEEEQLWQQASNRRSLDSDPFKEVEWYEMPNFQDPSGRKEIISKAAGTYVMTRLIGALTGQSAGEARKVALKEAAMNFGNDVSQSYRFNQRDIALAQGNTAASVQKWIRSGNDNDLQQEENQYLRGQGAKMDSRDVTFYKDQPLPLPLHPTGETLAPRTGIYTITSDPYTMKDIRIMFKKPISEEGESGKNLQKSEVYVEKGKPLPAPLQPGNSTVAPETGYYTVYSDPVKGTPKVTYYHDYIEADDLDESEVYYKRGERMGNGEIADKTGYYKEFWDPKTRSVRDVQFSDVEKTIKLTAKERDAKRQFIGNMTSAIRFRDDTRNLLGMPGLKNISGVASMFMPNLTQAGRDAQARVNEVFAQNTLERMGLITGVLTDKDMEILSQLENDIKAGGMSRTELTRRLSDIIDLWNERLIERWYWLSEKEKQDFLNVTGKIKEAGGYDYGNPGEIKFDQTTTSALPGRVPYSTNTAQPDYETMPEDQLIDSFS